MTSRDLALAAVFVIMAYVVSGCEEKKTKITCEHQTARIDCKAGYIFIHQASYGRNNRQTCPSPLIRQTSNCRSDISLQEVRKACQGHHRCSIIASNGVFGDPCFGTFKYLQFAYSCWLAPRMKITRRACEGTTLRLYCPFGYKIRISEAIYGRTSYHPCIHTHRHNLKCRAAKSYGIVKSQCDGKNRCYVRASNSVFGDPCYGTYKYLQVDYVCFK
ncbi:L-rhamnose-binding lectin CSL3-like [Corticium candelabrum]|uniref:L-rhamnose-binding lectin CSL3-like n=1 Tax=Corticium candelabrum TaxID=121492 RepID=UPI002E273CEB|nr:L-rhamnose-binding lectin CSL3-like [Corticium candelabrum]